MPNNPGKVKLLYWDSCVFLDLLEGTKEKVGIIKALMADAQNGKARIVTSIHSITEVARAKSEIDKLSKAAEEKIRKLWGPESLFELCDYHCEIAFQAVALMRAAKSAPAVSFP